MILVLDTSADGQGSLGAQKDLVIDTSPPYVLGVASSKPNGNVHDAFTMLLNQPILNRLGVEAACTLRLRYDETL